MRERLENTEDINDVRSIHDQLNLMENFLCRIQLSLPEFTELKEVFEIKNTYNSCDVNIRAVSVLVKTGYLKKIHMHKFRNFRGVT